MHQGAEHGRGNSQVPEHGAIASDQGVVVLARPPIVYLVSILAGFGLNAVWPARMMPSAIEPIGGWLLLLAVALFALSVREFWRARTPIRTRKPVTAVITTGPYRFSRQPHLSVVHAAATRPGRVGEQRLARGHAHSHASSDVLRRDRQRGAVHGAEVR